ncbi:MAG: type III-A CRISPR-associated protein Csm2 [Pseudomonadota bacterium]
MNEIKPFLDDKNKTFKDVSIIEFAPPGKWAEKIANQNKKMNTTQLRKVFTTIKSLELKVKGKKMEDKFDEPELYMLIPLLAYAKGRKVIPPDSGFYEMMKAIIGDGITGKIQTVGDFKQFVNFMTAIIAYHKEASTQRGGDRNE